MIAEQVRLIPDELPQPSAETRPTVYADGLGEWYVATSSLERRKGSGQYFTPPDVAAFMAALCEPRRAQEVALDAGAGSGVLFSALVEEAVRGGRTRHLRIDAYETDERLAMLTRLALDHAMAWAAERGMVVEGNLIADDFAVANAEALQTGTLFAADEPLYTLAIINPPYFKLRKSDLRARVASPVVHGQPNIYAICMAVAAHLLRPDGVMVSITPRSFATGDYFRLFRERLFEITVPEVVHVFDSRKDAFRRDEVLQENVIMRVRRDGGHGLDGAAPIVRVSSSHGRADLAGARSIDLPLDSILRADVPGKMLYLPTTDEEERLREFISTWSETLGTVGWAVSTGPVVSFRATEFLIYDDPPGNVEMAEGCHRVPLLLIGNVHPMSVTWPLPPNGKPQWIADCPASRYLLVPASNYVVTRRFTSKEQSQRMVAAPLLQNRLPSDSVGLENHLNYIYRVGGSLGPEEVQGLAALLNCRLMDRYFRLFSGHTQVNATELRTLPLPERHRIVEIGERVRAADARALDDIIYDVLDVPSDLRNGG